MRLYSEEWSFPGINYDKNIIIVNVKENSKTSNLLEFMKSTFNEESTRKIIIKGSDRACHKVVSLSELFKRTYEKVIYQTNKITSVLENSNNINCEDGNKIFKRKTIPTLWVLLSKDKLDQCPIRKIQKTVKGKADFEEWIKCTSFLKKPMENDKQKKRLKRPIQREDPDQVNPWARKKRIKPSEKK
ncbi:DNA/RNA-binding protein Alba-like family-containing protein [Strongyloides ratti]|uniref:DNA/RNA-binding protein Alba-like family-containing protein n=1 Tax=Strongyloides ratti TaxID=34506 RepID=A0A090LF19_STRRB|nr:DNA/RNA-binding protein Alba-like family-containing protein [Strongyloides ratti]CEF68362.1 DNA/RNA-binding protein Alba-like family-containing protein [Strongyloides ratti]